MEEVVVFVTAPSLAEGEIIGRYLVENRLVACANVIPGVTSIFRWKGNICREAEVLLILKTRKDLSERVLAEIKKRHSYSVPEVIVLPIVGGSEDYLAWVRESTQCGEL